MTSFLRGDPLSAEVLEMTERLPVKPATVVLEGRYVRLQPFDLARDADALHAVSNGSPVTLGERSCGSYDADALIWRYLFKGPFETAEALGAFLGESRRRRISARSRSSTRGRGARSGLRLIPTTRRST